MSDRNRLRAVAVLTLLRDDGGLPIEWDDDGGCGAWITCTDPACQANQALRVEVYEHQLADILDARPEQRYFDLYCPHLQAIWPPYTEEIEALVPLLLLDPNRFLVEP